MTDEERAKEAIYVLRLTDKTDEPWTLAILGACYAGTWIKREGAEAFADEMRRRFLLHVAAVRAEEREKAAKEAEANLTCCGHGAFNECDHKAAADEIAAAIRARGQS